MNEQNNERIAAVITGANERGILKRFVLSSPRSKMGDVKKAELRPVTVRGEKLIQMTEYRRDGKAVTSNMPESEAADIAAVRLGDEFRQLDVITTAGSCTALVSSKGKLHISDNISSTGGGIADIDGNDSEKNHILDGSEQFLRLLGVSDADGRIIDRRRAKFRQINRFLELVRDIEDKLPKAPQPLYILDLCCGKSYLTFAVYYYFSAILGRSVRMTGVDLKPDVIAYCSGCARSLGWDGLDFV